MSTINDRIKELRIALGMNQTEFGGKIGLKQTYLSQIENGSRPVTDKIKRIICLQSWNGNTLREEWVENGTGEMFFIQDKQTQIAEFLGDIQKDSGNNFKSRLVAALASFSEDEWDLLEKMIDSIQQK